MPHRCFIAEGDPDLKYLREVNETYGSKEFLVLHIHHFPVLQTKKLF